MSGEYGGTAVAVAHTPSMATPRASPRPQKLRILVLEDSPSDARLTQERLRGAIPRIDCDIATSLAEVSSLRLANADCALIDLGLPDASGLEALHRLRDMDPTLPIVVLTGLEDEATGLAALDQGAQDFLVKQHANGYTIARAIRYAIERKRLQLDLRFQALHDPLTGLPNRALFRDRLEHTLSGTSRRGGAVALLFADLDEFKMVNDSLGHLVGDELLVHVAQRLSACMRKSDTLARMGGDEFIVLCDGLADKRQAQLVADRMQESLAQPFLLAGHTVRVTISIGVAVSEDPKAKAEVLLRDADTALYAAKAAGRDRVVWFDQALHESAVEQLSLLNEVRHLLANGALRVAYQAIVGVDDGRPVGYEGLARILHPVKGLLGPHQFAAALDDPILVQVIDRLVMQTALTDLARWRRRSPDLWLSVNASGATIAAPRFADEVLAALRAEQLPPDSLVIEVLETAAVGKAGAAALAKLRAAGVRIALDDFGSGLSSLSQFLTINVDIIKLDLSLTAAATAGEPRALSLFHLLAHAGRDVGLRVVAEGIETGAELALAHGAGVPFAQGYLWGKPALVINGLRPKFPGDEDDPDRVVATEEE